MSSSSHSQFHSACSSSSSSSSTIDQDEMIARRKFEQKRRFQQKQGNHCTDVDSLMRTMFTDLKLQPQTTNQNLPGQFSLLSFTFFSFLFFCFFIVYFRVKTKSIAMFR